MKKGILILSGFIAMLLVSCSYDVTEELKPIAPACSNTNVSYSVTIVPLLRDGGCLGCHKSTFAGGGINLEGHNKVSEQALNGRLLGSISHSPGYSPMPKGRNKLSDCDISKVKAWIDAGYPNN